jgi:hypothetical protein
MSLKITPAAYRHAELMITRIIVFISSMLNILDERYPAKMLEGNVNRFGNLTKVK